MSAFLGADPGLDGFLCLLTDRGSVFWAMPASKVSRGQRINSHEVALILHELPPITMAALEKAQASQQQGSSSAFKTGDGYGVLRGCLSAARIAYEEVAPATWKKAMGVPKVGGKLGSAKTRERKAISIAHAQQLFPGVDLRASERCKVPHDGKAEALLLAEWARRRWSGGGGA